MYNDMLPTPFQMRTICSQITRYLNDKQACDALYGRNTPEKTGKKSPLRERAKSNSCEKVEEHHGASYHKIPIACRDDRNMMTIQPLVSLQKPI